MERAQTHQPTQYALGHADAELERLIKQAQFFGELTAQVFQRAGIAPGMRVLDVGCGAGDVAFLAASMVGPGGSVLGVDKSPEAIAFATQRAEAAGLTNVRFIHRDLADLALDEAFDALVGRLVLMYFADPGTLLGQLAALVRPGGVVAFHEFDLAACTSEPRCGVFETAIERLTQTFGRVGADCRAGRKLGQIFDAAGLPSPQMIAGARVERGAESDVYGQVTRITQTLLPLIIRTGVASAEEVGIETLAERMRAESVALRATLFSPVFIGAWARTAAA